ncbi:YjzC family protein [Pelosinus propionicus]|uniref:YjzC-like protein n=1 Tax=Pelosinus propionicus DSM 13327 TaxID=1123291 RepID=A0A1I4PXL7_9FIRM|nr:YjzC family protein [Pelosinus propionicus]SFM32494.1 YjzC-like protein [Pelosinus propionicus DSM 13327]
MPKPIKPGTDNELAGTYIEVGSHGNSISNPRTIEIDPGDRLPPTQENGHGWEKK